MEGEEGKFNEKDDISEDRKGEIKRKKEEQLEENHLMDYQYI